MIKRKEMCATIDENLALTMFVELGAYDYLTFRGGEKNTQENVMFSFTDTWCS
jgi:hypothetical protein